MTKLGHDEILPITSNFCEEKSCHDSAQIGMWINSRENLNFCCKRSCHVKPQIGTWRNSHEDHNLFREKSCYSRNSWQPHYNSREILPRQKISWRAPIVSRWAPIISWQTNKIGSNVLKTLDRGRSHQQSTSFVRFLQDRANNPIPLITELKLRKDPKRKIHWIS